MPEFYDKALHARWDNQRGMVAWFGRKGAIGYRCEMAVIIANAAQRGAVHAR